MKTDFGMIEGSAKTKRSKSYLPVRQCRSLRNLWKENDNGKIAGWKTGRNRQCLLRQSCVTTGARADSWRRTRRAADGTVPPRRSSQRSPAFTVLAVIAPSPPHLVE
jgi:hypothetical protein